MKENPYNSKFFLWLNQTPIEEHQQVYKDICKGYGLEDQGTIERLSEYAFQVFIYGKIGQYESLELKDLEFRRDLAILTSIFKNGRGIKIQASMPDGEFKEKHITFKVETSDLLQQLAFYSLNTLLANTIEYDLEMKEKWGVERKGEVKLPYWIDTSRTTFREPFFDDELATIIGIEDGRVANEKAMKGRKEIEIPKLGSMVHGLIEAGGDVLASLKPFPRYCLIGDLMLATGVSPVEQVEWEKVLTNKDKADMVKHWEESYLKIVGK